LTYFVNVLYWPIAKDRVKLKTEWVLVFYEKEEIFETFKWCQLETKPTTARSYIELFKSNGGFRKFE